MPDPYISEVKYLGGANVDFVEISVAAGMDVSNVSVTIYNPDGTVRTVNALETLTDTFMGQDIYVLDLASSSTFNGLHKLGGVALEVDGTVTQFISFDDGSPLTAIGGAADGMTSTQIGQAGSGASLESTDGGQTYTTQTNPTKGTIPCFTAGTLIRTPGGEVPVEDIAVGDLVETRDHGAQPVRWAGRRRVSHRALRANPRLGPVLIRAGALGGGLPARDLRVSRQHRMLLSAEAALDMVGAREVLIPAIKLRQLRGVSPDLSGQPVDYVHLLFDRHEVIWAEGSPSESLYTGPQALKALDSEARAELLQLFPQLEEGPVTPLNRPVLERRRAVAELLDAMQWSADHR